MASFVDIVDFVTKEAVVSTKSSVDFVSDVGEYFTIETEVEISAINVQDYFPFVDPIPKIHEVVLAAVIAFLSFFLNALVVKFYIKSKQHCRSYILALVGLDWFLILFGLGQFVALSFIDDISTFIVVLNMFMVATNFGFGLYLYPSLFLAVDRFVVVIFPLKFREMKWKIFSFKTTLFGVHFAAAVADSVIQIVYKPGSFPSTVMKFIVIAMDLFELLALAVMYTTIVVMIIKTNRELAAARHTGIDNNRLVVHNVKFVHYLNY